MADKDEKHIVIAITGASGSIYAKNIINKLIINKDIKLSLIISDEAKKVCAYELGEDFLDNLSCRKYNNDNFFAEFASGSAAPDALMVIPCTAGTMGRIANGTSDNLICRTADVVLKERKKLVLVLRETPYNLIHIKNMERITLAGGIICPATPSFYSKPKDINELIDTVVNRALDLCEIENESFRWG